LRHSVGRVEGPLKVVVGIVPRLLQNDESLSHLCQFNPLDDLDRFRIPKIEISAPRLLMVAPETLFIRSCSNILPIRAR
jgi:hypothetical protein